MLEIVEIPALREIGSDADAHDVAPITDPSGDGSSRPAPGAA